MALTNGITVNQQSEISGPEWLKKINGSEDVPDYFKEQMHWKNKRIRTPKTFKTPSNVIQKNWLKDWLSAFQGDWEISTHHLEVTVETLDEIVARQRKTADKAGQKITIKIVSHLSKGEKLDRWARVQQTWDKMIGRDGPEVTKGWTWPRNGVSLKSGRGIILIATRIELNRGPREEKFEFKDDELVETIFHEIACHAGRITQGLVDTHGDDTVEAHKRDIEAMFPQATTVEKMYDFILKVAFEEAGFRPTGRGTLGLKNDPVVDSGTLARTASRSPRTMGV